MEKLDTSRINILKEILNRFELYLATVIFFVMMFLLTVQVVSRYIGFSITWTEELSCILLVWMSYLGFAAAITSRKHLRIDALMEAVPFKFKKILLIFSNVINGLFAALLIFPMLSVINNFRSIHAVSPIMRIPKVLSFSILPFSMFLIIIRTIQECKRLYGESEKKLGVGKPLLDIPSLEAEAKKVTI